MANMTAPLDELSTAHLVVLEAPPNVAARFEHDMLSLVSRIMAQGPEVAVMVSRAFAESRTRHCGYNVGTALPTRRSSFARRAHVRPATTYQDVI